MADGTPATGITAEFRFEDDRAGDLTQTEPIWCDPVIVASDQPDVWALVRVRDRLAASWPILDLASHGDPAVGDPAFVIQHPLGQRKRLEFVRTRYPMWMIESCSTSPTPRSDRPGHRCSTDTGA